MTFYERLRAERTKKGLSSQEMAIALGIAPSTYSQYENGRREPDVMRIKAITSFLDVSADYLLFGENAPIHLSTKEHKLISDFRTLSKQGQDYIVQTMDMVKEKYRKETKMAYDTEYRLIADSAKSVFPHKDDESIIII